jgi:hypothetical protein
MTHLRGGRTLVTCSCLQPWGRREAGEGTGWGALLGQAQKDPGSREDEWDRGPSSLSHHKFM